MSRLRRLLSKDAQGIDVSVEGLAGIGKTELALQIVHELSQERSFTGGIFWLDSEQPDLRPVWATLAERYGIVGGSTEQSAAELIRRLSASGAPVLIVLDNVASWSSRRAPGPLPEGAHIRLLVTTRERNVGGARFAHIEVGFLPHPDDRGLLTAVAGREIGPEADALLDRLGGYSLAIELAGAFLATHSGEDATSYLELLERNSAAVEAEISDRVRYERTVEQAFSATWERLADVDRRHWILASCFAAEPASRALSDTVGLDASARRSLERAYLIRTSPDGRWIMHRLTKAFGERAGTDEQRKVARQSFVQGCVDLATGPEVSAHAIYRADPVHIDAAIRMAPRVMDEKSELHLLMTFGEPVLGQRGYTSDTVEELFSRAAELGASGPDQLGQLHVLLRLWFALLGRWDWVGCQAIEHRVAVLVDRSSVPSHAAFSHLIAGTRCFVGAELCEALHHLDRVVAIAAEVRGLPQQGVLGPVLSILEVLALSHAALADLQLGFPDRALQRSETALKLIELGAPNDLLPAAQYAHGIARYMRGEFAEAEETFSRAFDFAVQAHMVLYRELHAFCLAMARVGRGSRDVDLLLETMRTRFEELERLHYLNPMLLIFAADTCLRAARPQEARVWVEAAQAISAERTMRTHEPDLWRLRGLLASNSAEGRRCLERAIELAERRGTSWEGLRAASELVLASETIEARSVALRKLRETYDRISEGESLECILRAKGLLESGKDRPTGS